MVEHRIGSPRPHPEGHPWVPGAQAEAVFHEVPLLHALPADDVPGGQGDGAVLPGPGQQLADVEEVPGLLKLPAVKSGASTTAQWAGEFLRRISPAAPAGPAGWCPWRFGAGGSPPPAAALRPVGPPSPPAGPAAPGAAAGGSPESHQGCPGGGGRDEATGPQLLGGVIFRSRSPHPLGFSRPMWS